MSSYRQAARFMGLNARTLRLVGMGFLIVVPLIEIGRLGSRHQRLQQILFAVQAELERTRQEVTEVRDDADRQSVETARYEGALAGLAQTVGSLYSQIEAIHTAASERKSESELAETACAQALALGIAWQETSGKENWRIFGTGFLAGKGRIGVTAGHVIQELVRTHDDLHRRGLAPRLVLVTPRGLAVAWSCYVLHPSLTPAATIPLTDLGAIRCDETIEDVSTDLIWASDDATPGTIAVTAGYPVELMGIAYAHPSKVVPRPTVKFGHVERVGAPLQIAERSHSVISAETLQHDLAVGGGFSGALLFDGVGHAIGVITWSNHLTLSQSAPRRTGVTGTIRLLNAAGGNFALPASVIRPWIDGLTAPANDIQWERVQTN